jgi:hypothetical protein
VEWKPADWVLSRHGLLVPRALRQKSRGAAIAKASIGLAFVATQLANIVSLWEHVVADTLALVRELSSLQLP